MVNIIQESATWGTDVYGVAFLDERGEGKLCDVFFNRILRLHGSGRADLAHILGIVIAHELGHLLLGFNAHSAEGLMKAQFKSQDFLPGQYAPVLTPQQVLRIHNRLVTYEQTVTFNTESWAGGNGDEVVLQHH